MSSLITGLLENLPDRLSIKKALSHTWLNPSDKKLDEGILFYEPHMDGAEHDDDDDDEEMNGVDEDLISNTNSDED